MTRFIALALAGLTLSACSSERASTPEEISGSMIEVYLTGYSWHDNDPPGSAAIAHPRIHRTAGGTGTFKDPITLAVGSSISSRRVLDYDPGTRFYLPRLRKYAIVEDLCGSCAGHEPGTRHGEKKGAPWIDIYVDGRHSGNEAANACMYKITGYQFAVLDPQPGLPVVAGALTEGGCEKF